LNHLVRSPLIKPTTFDGLHLIWALRIFFATPRIATTLRWESASRAI
jgi:hypothetical protein